VAAHTGVDRDDRSHERATAPGAGRQRLARRQLLIVTEHGYAADYVKNIQRQPRMRMKVGRHWYDGTAQILADDDPRQRLRWLGRPVNDAFLLLIGTQQLTICVDLDR